MSSYGNLCRGGQGHTGSYTPPRFTEVNLEVDVDLNADPDVNRTSYQRLAGYTLERDRRLLRRRVPNQNPSASLVTEPLGREAAMSTV